jgi:hypothetical protein
VDSLISKGVHHNTHVTLVLVGSHYDGVDFNVIGQGHALGRPEGDILAIESAAALGTEALVGRVLVASVHRSFILLGYRILSWIARALWTVGL